MKSCIKPCRKTLNLGIILFLAGGAFACADNVYVSDSAGGTILQFNSTGNESIFASGLDNPAGIAFDGNGNLYVANSGSGTILRFDPNGNESVFASGLDNPTGLAFGGSGILYVANSGAGTILQFNSSGIGSVFASGLISPAYLAFGNSGNLYASTPRTIEEFDSAGNQSTVFTALNYVAGIVSDQAGNLYASLQNSGSIVRLNDGVVTGGIAFNDPLHTSPTGLGLDGSGNLFVAFGGVSGEYNPMGGSIEEYDSTGNGTVFVSGLDNPQYLVVQSVQGIKPVEFVPEPSSWVIAIAGFGVLLAGRRRQKCRA